MMKTSSEVSESPRDLLRLDGLTVSFAGPGSASPGNASPGNASRQALTPVLRGVSFSLRRGECFALVGESGCGKTFTALAILGLLPAGGRLVAGSIELAGAGDVTLLSERRRRQLLGRRIAMVFQEPSSALNPVLSIGFQISEALTFHQSLSRRQARRRVEELLDQVAMPEPRQRMASYPHELSGGLNQRAMLALALASGPELLVADEPTTALDMTIQAQILDLLAKLRRELSLTVLLITHDLGVVAQCADRAAVMYAGEIVEETSVEALFDTPAHPYTEALLRAVPRLGSGDRLALPIAGQVPEPGALPEGCLFHPRCPQAFAPCRTTPPAILEPRPKQRVRCHLYATGEDTV
jgi:oligopeptide/dipeptide ABC transporter ATP-binding protein